VSDAADHCQSSGVPAATPNREPLPALSALIVENSGYDVDRVVGALEDAGYRPLHWRRVEDSMAMTTAIAEEIWDVVISEDRMPAFDPRNALAVLRDSGAEVPLVVVSGKVAHGAATTAFRAGAADFVSDDRFDRLGSVVARCLRHTGEERRRWEPAEAGVRDSQEGFRASVETLIDPSVVLRPLRNRDGEVVEFVYEYANGSACEASGLTRENLVGLRMLARVTQLAPAGLFDAYATVVETGGPLALKGFTDAWAPQADRRLFDVWARRAGDLLVLTWREVTERVRTEPEIDQLAPVEGAVAATMGGSNLGLGSQVALLAELGIAAVATDLDGVVCECNRAAAEIYGRRESDLLGVAIGTVRLAEADGAVAGSIVRGLLEVGCWRGELEIQDANGLPLRLDVRARVGLDSADRPAGFEVVFGDLSKPVQAERRACDTDSRTRVDDRAAGLGFWDWDPRSDRLITSDSFTALLGLAPGTELTMASAQVGWGSDGDRDRHALECHDASASLMREWVDRLTRHDETIDPQDQPMTDAARVIAPTV
jgi:PAS domain-containing protein